jgi:multiple sugar transport system substrate-binding protein
MTSTRRRPWLHRSAVVPAIAALALVGGLTACSSSGGNSGHSKGGGSSTSTVTFANWADAEPATRPGIRNMIKKFEKSHPKIKVKSVPISFSDIGHKLVLQVQSGNPPDVAELSGNDTFALAATGALAPLDSYASGIKSSITPSEITGSTYKGKLIAMPWTVNPPGLWYNKKLLAGAGISKPPATMDQLSADLKAIHQKDPSVDPLGIDTTNRDFALTSNWSWMKAFGATPFHGSTANADTPQMKAYLTWLRQNKAYISAGHKIGDFRPLAASNKVAFVWDQPVLQGVVQSTNHASDSEFYKTWGVASLPKGPGGKSYTVELGHQLGMFNKAGNKKAAWTFMKWIATNPTAVADYTIKYESSLPPLKNPGSSVASKLNTPVFKAFKALLPQITKPPYGPTYDEAYTPIMAAVQDAVTSSKSIDSLASGMQSGLKNAFK